MKKLSAVICFLFIAIIIQAGSKNQEQPVTATLKSASRLFSAKEDITSVIVIVPSGSVVTVLGSDSTYLKISFEDNDGYIYKRDAMINKTPTAVTNNTKQEPTIQNERPAGEKQVSRFTYLENKYGTSMAALLAAGKIWKGMTGDMVRDSWGSPLKINRVIGNNVKEEWIYKNTWLYIENNTLVDWGPVKQ